MITKKQKTMKQTAYIRVSTEAQSYDRQRLEFETYFKNRGIDSRTVEFVEEKITSHTSFRQRAIYKVLKKAEPGDIVYACQLDRFGRTVEDIIQLTKFADSRDVILTTLDGYQVTYKTMQGKMLLTIMAMVAEMERELRAERCQSGTDAAIAEIKKNGYRIARSSGKVQTKWGNEKGCDMSAAQAAASVVRIDRKMQWRENSPAFKWVMDKIKAGVSRKEVIEEFNNLHRLQPEVFCTPQGRPLSKGILSYWIKESRI